MKLSDFLYNLDEFYVRSQEQNLPATVSKEWDILYNKYQDFNEPFLEPSNPNARDNGALADLMREILIFVLDNFRYFNYCFAYDIEQRRAIMPRLTVANYDVILGKLIQDYIIFEEKPDFTEEAESKLDAIYKRVLSGTADWTVPAWIVNFVSDELGYYIVDNENGTYEFVKRTWNEETENWEFTDVLNVAYFAEEIDDLIKAVTNYTDFEDGVYNADEVPVEIVNIVFDKDATIAKADGDTILVATLSNDDELTFYVDNSGEIAFIEENGVDAFDSLMGVYDTEILEFYNNNIAEILNTFEVMHTGDLSKRTFTGIHGETWNVELMNFANLIPGETKLTFKCISEEIGNTVYVSFLNGEYFENYDEDEDETDIVDNTRLMDELESWANQI